jgi:hypothetical protein
MKKKEIPPFRSYQFIITSARLTTYPDFQTVDVADAKPYAPKENRI